MLHQTYAADESLAARLRKSRPTDDQETQDRRLGRTLMLELLDLMEGAPLLIQPTGEIGVNGRLTISVDMSGLDGDPVPFLIDIRRDPDN